MSDVHAMMAHYEDLKARQDLEKLKYEEACAAVLTPEQQQQIASLTAAYNNTMEEVNDHLTKVEEQLKHAVLLHAQTVKGQRYRAEFRSGRKKWDTKGLTNWFKAHDVDTLTRFYTEGPPTIALVAINKNGNG